MPAEAGTAQRCGPGRGSRAAEVIERERLAVAAPLQRGWCRNLTAAAAAMPASVETTLAGM